MDLRILTSAHSGHAKCYWPEAGVGAQRTQVRSWLFQAIDGRECLRPSLAPPWMDACAIAVRYLPFEVLWGARGGAFG